MYKAFTINNNFKWFDKLQNFLKFYNNRVHRTIRMKPIDVNRENEKDIYERVFKERNRKVVADKIKFPIGTYVRISKHKNLFEKGFTANFSNEVFRVIGVNRIVPVTYFLEDFFSEPILGSFYTEELTKVGANPKSYLVEKILRRKGNKVLVKYLGMDKSHNSWIDKKSVL